MEQKLEKQIYTKLNNIEKEIKSLQKALLFMSPKKIKNPVSFRGIAKTFLGEEELDEAIEEAKKSLFPHKGT